MWHKLFLLFVYLFVLFILFRFWELYCNATTNTVLDPFLLNSVKLKHVLEHRGLLYSDIYEKSDLSNLLQASGRVTKCEVTESEKSKISFEVEQQFTGAAHFNEQVEDCKDSAWIVHVVDHNGTPYLSSGLWAKLMQAAAPFGIRFGTFDCRVDPTWRKPLASPRPVTVSGATRSSGSSVFTRSASTYDNNYSDSPVSDLAELHKVRFSTTSLIAAAKKVKHQNPGLGLVNTPKVTRQASRILEEYYKLRFSEKKNQAVQNRSPRLNSPTADHDGFNEDLLPSPESDKFHFPLSSVIEEDMNEEERSRDAQKPQQPDRPVVSLDHRDHKASVASKTKRKLGQTLKYFYQKFGLQHILLSSILLLYMVLGAVLFYFLENPNENLTIEKNKNISIARHINYTQWILSTIMENCTMLNTNNTEPVELNGTELMDCRAALKEVMVQYDQETGLDDRLKPPLYQWDFFNSLFYAGTLFTTIGYGNMSCKTFAGRLATILYATIGIPIMLTVLNDLGRVIFVLARRSWNAARRCYRHRVLPRFQKTIGKEVTTLDRPVSTITNNQEDSNNDVDANFPLALALFIVFSYTFLCAVLFMLWEEEWDYFTAFYFFFVSLSTIGLGDVLPNHPHYTSCAFIFFIIGLALVSMCVNVMQAKVESKYLAAMSLIEEAYWADEGGWMENNPEVPPTPLSPGDMGRRPLSSLESHDDSSGPHSAALGVFQIYSRPSIGSMSRRDGSMKDSMDEPHQRSPALKPISEQSDDIVRKPSRGAVETRL